MTDSVLPSRTAHVTRNTSETQIEVRLNLDGTGQGTLNSGVPFLDHMLDQIKRHGLFDIELTCHGDLHIDDHHTVEDCGITLGQAFAKALDAAGTDPDNLAQLAERARTLRRNDDEDD